LKYDIIIIGAGAAGLLAAGIFTKAGYRVCLLEAAAAAGGRMATVEEAGFDRPVETGAEFVHGPLPLTLSLLDAAGIGYTEVTGSMMTVKQGQWQPDQEHDPQWTKFLLQLGRLKTDTTMAAFLQQYFPGSPFNSLRQAVQDYAEGFDLADLNTVSAVSLKEEWTKDEVIQYRITGGYQRLVDFLLNEMMANKGHFHCNSVVTAVQQDQDTVVVHTADGKLHHALAVLLTVPASILQAGTIQFIPALPAMHQQAFGDIGFGAVIKLLLQFKQPFWENTHSNIGFLLSDELIPTWWTQSAKGNALLTGWIGGPPATAMQGNDDTLILQSALESLAHIFRMRPTALRRQLIHHRICCWQRMPFIQGGYSFAKMGAAAAKQVLGTAAGRIFFAGEACYSGPSQGTVEAALQTGSAAAKKIIAFIPTPSGKLPA
jgi:monoamine oxidase